MASTLVALQTVTVGAGGVSSITFSSIPQTYTDLVVKASARTSTTDGSSPQKYLTISFNGSTSNLSSRFLFGNGSTAGSASDTTIYSWANGNTSTASTFGNFEIYVPNYTSSNFKSVSLDIATENNATAAYLNLEAGLWANTSAITSLAINLDSGTLVQYSTFTLYGVYKDAAETTPAAPTIGTATAGSQAADVAFTPAGSGAPASSYVVTSSPGGLTATGGSSPIQIGGLTSGTAYTFTVRGQNPGGLGAASAASNSVTPYDGYESIATLYGSGASSVTFSSIPSTYTHLQIRLTGRSNRASTRDSVKLTFNSDTGANYTEHGLYGDGSTAASYAVTSATGISTYRIAGGSAASNIQGTIVIDILDYANTNKYKTLRSLGGVDLNGSGEIYFNSGLWLNTSAINNIVLTPIGTIQQYSVFELYGIRG